MKKWLIVILVIAVITGIYYFTPLSEYLKIDKVESLLENVPDNWITMLASMIVFFFGGVLLIPVPLMSFGLSLVFPLWKACLLAVAGAIFASSSGYILGRLINIDIFGKTVTKHLEKIKKKIDDKEEFAILALRVAPTPPFTVTSLLAGSLKINYLKYALYSSLGIAPLMYLTLFMGESFLRFLKEPTGMGAMLLGASILGFIGYKVYKNKTQSE